MAALAKRGKKKNKKGANFEVEGEDAPVNNAAADDLASKAPQEGTFDDDEDDVFAGNYGKKKGKGGAAAAAEKEKPEEPAAEKTDDAPRVKTKAEKEKEKKEKEKQRKKELVCFHLVLDTCALRGSVLTWVFQGCEEESYWSCEGRTRKGRRVQARSRCCPLYSYACC
jgi:hypothetical protein